MKTPMAVFAALWLAACTPATPDTAASTRDAAPAGPVAAPPAAAPASAIADDPSAVNQAIDRLRRRKRRAGEQSIEDDARALDLRADTLEADQIVYGREIQERLTRALEGLPDGQRAVFVLRHYDQLSLDEISATLEMNLGTVKSSLHRALQHLRRRMGSLRP